MQEHAEDIHSRPLHECPHCGKGLPESVSVCPHCGTQVERAGHVPQTTEEKS